LIDFLYFLSFYLFHLFIFFAFFIYFYLFLSFFILIGLLHRISEYLVTLRESRIDEVIDTMPPLYRSMIVAMTK